MVSRPNCRGGSRKVQARNGRQYVHFAWHIVCQVFHTHATAQQLRISCGPNLMEVRLRMKMKSRRNWFLELNLLPSAPD